MFGKKNHIHHIKAQIQAEQAEQRMREASLHEADALLAHAERLREKREALRKKLQKSLPAIRAEMERDGVPPTPEVVRRMIDHAIPETARRARHTLSVEEQERTEMLREVYGEECEKVFFLNPFTGDMDEA